MKTFGFKAVCSAGFLAVLACVALFSAPAEAKRLNESPLHALGEAYQKQYIGLKKLGPNATAEQKERVSSEAFQHSDEVMGKEMSRRARRLETSTNKFMRSTADGVASMQAEETPGAKGYKRFLGRLKGGKRPDTRKGKGPAIANKSGSGKDAPAKPGDQAPVTGKAAGRAVGGPASQGGATGAEKVDYSKDTDPDEDGPAPSAKSAPSHGQPAKGSSNEPPAKKKRVIVNGVIQEQ